METEPDDIQHELLANNPPVVRGKAKLPGKLGLHNGQGGGTSQSVGNLFSGLPIKTNHDGVADLVNSWVLKKTASSKNIKLPPISAYVNQEKNKVLLASPLNQSHSMIKSDTDSLSQAQRKLSPLVLETKVAFDQKSPPLRRKFSFTSPVTAFEQPQSNVAQDSTKSWSKKKKILNRRKSDPHDLGHAIDSNRKVHAFTSKRIYPETSLQTYNNPKENDPRFQLPKESTLKDDSSPISPFYQQHHTCNPAVKTVAFVVLFVIIVIGYGVIDTVISGLYFTPTRTGDIFGFKNATISSANDFESCTFSLFIPAFDFLWKYMMILRIFPSILGIKMKTSIGILGVAIRMLARFFNVFPSITLDTPTVATKNPSLWSDMINLYLTGGQLNLLLRTMLEIWFLPLIFSYYSSKNRVTRGEKSKGLLLQVDNDKIFGGIALGWNIMYYVAIGVYFYRFEVAGVDENSMASALFNILFLPWILIALKVGYNSLNHLKQNQSLSCLFLACWLMMIVLDFFGNSLYFFQTLNEDFLKWLVSLFFSFGYEVLQQFFIYIVTAIGVARLNTVGFIFFIQFGKEFLDQMLLLELKITDGLFIALVILQIAWGTLKSTGSLNTLVESIVDTIQHFFGTFKCTVHEFDNEELEKHHFQIKSFSQEMLAETVATFSIPTLIYMFALLNPDLLTQYIYFYGMTSLSEYYDHFVVKRFLVILACRIIKNIMAFFVLKRKLTRMHKNNKLTGCSISCLVYSHFRKGWGMLFLLLSIVYMNIMTGIYSGLGVTNPKVMNLLSSLPQYENYSYPSYWDITIARIVAT